MHDKGEEALGFMKEILSELQTMNQINSQLVQQNAQLVRQNGQLTQQLVASFAQERDSQALTAQLSQRMSELAELLVEEEDLPATHYPPTPYRQQPTLGQHLMDAGMEAFGMPRPRRGRRRRGG